MNKDITTVYLSKDLKALAKSKKLNLSLLLEDSISYYLSVSDDRQDILNKKRDLMNELSVVESKLKFLDEQDKKQVENNKKKEFFSDLNDLTKIYFSEKAMNNPGVRENPISVFCDKHNMSRENVLKLLLSKTPIKKEESDL